LALVVTPRLTRAIIYILYFFVVAWLNRKTGSHFFAPRFL